MGQQTDEVVSNGTRKKYLYTFNLSVSLRLLHIFFLLRHEIVLVKSKQMSPMKGTRAPWRKG